MQIIHGYRNDEALRRSFNALAEATFGLNFENWYQLGYWGDHYDPWSVVIDGEVVSNVSVNRTDLVIDGQVRHFLQLGTVMTAEKHRNKGYARAIMEQLEPVLAAADGVYLFGNDSVLAFYPKFGFVKGREFRYSGEFTASAPLAQRSDMTDPAVRKALELAMESSFFQDRCHMVQNSGLIFFYAAQFLADCVWYWPERNAWIIAEEDEGLWTLHNVFGPADVTAEEAVRALGIGGKVVLGFSPSDPENWDEEELIGEDCTFFVRGRGFSDFAEKHLRIPSLSHA